MATFTNNGQLYYTNDTNYDPFKLSWNKPDDYDPANYSPGGNIFTQGMPSQFQYLVNRIDPQVQNVAPGVPSWGEGPYSPPIVNEGMDMGDPATREILNMNWDPLAGPVATSIPNNMSQAATLDAALKLRGNLTEGDLRKLWPQVQIPDADIKNIQIMNLQDPNWWADPKIGFQFDEGGNEFGEMLGAAMMIGGFASGLGNLLNFASPGMGFNFGADLFGSLGWGGGAAGGSGLSLGSSGLGLQAPTNWGFPEGALSTLGDIEPALGGTTWTSPFNDPNWFTNGATATGTIPTGGSIDPMRAVRTGTNALQRMQQNEQMQSAQEAEEERRRRAAQEAAAMRQGALQSLGNSRYSTPMSMRTFYGAGPFGRI